MNPFWSNGWVWLAVTSFTLGLCTYLPIKIKNDKARKMVYWFILIPASLILMFYCYPSGLEVFRRLALSF